MRVGRELARKVEARGQQRCEYCRMHQALQGATFHVEHVLPESCGGLTEMGNLAWACPACNLHKSDRTQGVDPDTAQPAPLFNPRAHCWDEHFAWDGTSVRGLTAVGRATVLALNLNGERRQLIRAAEGLFGLFPP